MTQESFPFYIAPWYRKSPFFEATKRAGCQSWGLYNHMLLPTLYEDPVSEYNALASDVTLWDVSVERIVEITGPDAHKLANVTTCRDLSKCEVMQCKYVLLTADDGGIVNDPVLLRLGENHYWLALADSDAGLFVRGVAAGMGLDARVTEPDVYPVQVQGPRSKDVIRRLFGDEVADIRYYWCAEASVDGIPVVVSRTGWTGEVGYEVYLRDASRGDDLWNRILEAGAPHGIKVIAPSEARRIEAGIFNYGSDIRVSDTPFHVTGLERLVEEQNEHYIGKEALERLRREGVDRKLVGVEVAGDALDEEQEFSEYWSVSKDGKTVGRLTACAWSPRLEKNVGFAWVPIDLIEPGTKLDVEAPGGSIVATVQSLPFLDPNKDIPKS